VTIRKLNTGNGTLDLPAFLPDATRGAVRTLGTGDLDDVGVQGVVVNAFHLGERPGISVISRLGGIHRFMGFRGPVASDSGGFQIYSLRAADPKFGTVSPKGFRTHRTGGGDGRKLLTPEKAIRRQLALGADMLVCLDHCTGPGAGKEELRDAVEHTVAWAAAGKRAFEEECERTGRRPLLFAVVQGGGDPDLRRECAGRLGEIGFDGYGFGGWPVDGEGRLVETVGVVAESFPPGTPLWGMGVGRPEGIVEACGRGYMLFDCVWPTRGARRGRLLVRGGRDVPVKSREDYRIIQIRDERHVRSEEPLDEFCSGPCCREHSRAYLHHLFRVGESLGPRLGTMHNLRFYVELMKSLRDGA
jgi:queuine tRNA-ribosyltransferase